MNIFTKMPTNKQYNDTVVKIVQIYVNSPKMAYQSPHNYNINGLYMTGQYRLDKTRDKSHQKKTLHTQTYLNN